MDDGLRNLKIDKVTVFIFAVAILGMSLILLRTSTYGIGVGSDEANFIAMARNLAAGDGLLDYQRSKVHSATWPPLYPVTLAVADFLGVDALVAARFINAATFGLIVLVSGLWLKKRVKSPWLAGAGTVAIFVSPSLTFVSSHALSEPLFILFMLLTLFQMDNLLGDGKRSAVIWAAMFAALAALSRYIGVTIIAAGLLMLLFDGRWKYSDRAIHLGTYAVIASAPLALWLLRNHLVTGLWTGGRASTQVSVPEVISMIVETLFSMMLPWQRLGNAINSIFNKAGLGVDGEDILMLLAITLLILMAGAVLWSRIHLAPRLHGRTSWRPLVPFGIFAFVHLVCLAALSATVSLATPADHRYVLPAYIALVFVVVLLVDESERLNWMRVSKYGLLGIALTVIAVLSVLYQATANFNTIGRSIEEGHRYTSKQWNESNIIRHINTHGLDGQIYSNVPDAIYILTGTQAELRMFPGEGRTDKSGNLPELEAILAKSGKETRVIWFEDIPWRQFGFTRHEMESTLDIEPVLESPEGVMYRVKPR